MTQTVPSGRYWAKVNEGDWVDDNSIIGYDERTQTYLFRSGRDHQRTGEPLH